jgi:hypothetical protein
MKKKIASWITKFVILSMLLSALGTTVPATVVKAAPIENVPALSPALDVQPAPSLHHVGKTEEASCKNGKLHYHFAGEYVGGNEKRKVDWNVTYVIDGVSTTVSGTWNGKSNGFEIFDVEGDANTSVSITGSITMWVPDGNGWKNPTSVTFNTNKNNNCAPTSTKTATPSKTPSPTRTPTSSRTPTSTPTTTPDPWDKSSIKVEGMCVDGKAVFLITNTGEAMSGPSTYQVYWAGIPFGGAQSFTLGAGGSMVVSFDFFGVSVKLVAEQRPGHPGNSHPQDTVYPNECSAPSATPTVTSTATSTATSTPTVTFTPTDTASPTITPSLTNTPTDTPTVTTTPVLTYNVNLLALCGGGMVTGHADGPATLTVTGNGPDGAAVNISQAVGPGSFGIPLNWVNPGTFGPHAISLNAVLDVSGNVVDSELVNTSVNCGDAPTQTLTSTPTFTNTPFETPTFTPTATETVTGTPTIVTETPTGTVLPPVGDPTANVECRIVDGVVTNDVTINIVDATVHADPPWGDLTSTITLPGVPNGVYNWLWDAAPGHVGNGVVSFTVTSDCDEPTTRGVWKAKCKDFCNGERWETTSGPTTWKSIALTGDLAEGVMVASVNDDCYETPAGCIVLTMDYSVSKIGPFTVHDRGREFRSWEVTDAFGQTWHLFIGYEVTCFEDPNTSALECGQILEDIVLPGDWGTSPHLSDDDWTVTPDDPNTPVYIEGPCNLAPADWMTRMVDGKQVAYKLPGVSGNDWRFYLFKKLLLPWPEGWPDNPVPGAFNKHAYPLQDANAWQAALMDPDKPQWTWYYALP